MLKINPYYPYQSNRTPSLRQVNKPDNISFASKPLYELQIIEDNKPVQASFNKLNTKDRADIEAVEELNFLWQDTTFAKYLKHYFTGKPYQKKCSFYTVELKNPYMLLSKKIKSFAATEINKKEMKLFLLQSSPDSIKFSRSRKYSRAGEAALYGLVKQAQAKNLDRIVLTSANDSKAFYGKMGFTPLINGDLELKRKDFDAFLKEREQRLGIS